MESIRRMRSLGAVLTLWIGGSLAPAGANDVQPAISHQAATDIAVKLVQQVTHGHLFSIAALHFEPSTREWFSTARNYAMYSNQGGTYDDVLKYLKM